MVCRRVKLAGTRQKQKEEDVVKGEEKGVRETVKREEEGNAGNREGEIGEEKIKLKSRKKVRSERRNQKQKEEWNEKQYVKDSQEGRRKQKRQKEKDNEQTSRKKA